MHQILHSFKTYFFLIFTLSFLQLEAQKSNYYKLSWSAPNQKNFYVHLIVEPSSDTYTDFCLPAWRPGRYILQNYSASVFGFSASEENGQSLNWKKIDKDTWRVFHQKTKKKIVLKYTFYAGQLDAGSSYVAENMIYFNGSNLFMYVKNRLNVPCFLELLEFPKNWKKATALTSLNDTLLYADNYHDFIDAPTVFSSKITTFTFSDKSTNFYLEFYGNYLGDNETSEYLVTQVKRLVQEQMAVFGEYPMKEYHFIYLLLPYNYRHAVEHSFSSCFTLPDEVTSSKESVKYGLLGITSHEFWHLWNVKRIRPAAMWPYQYQTEAYTTLHWFTEGVTSYFEELALVRSGLITREDFYSRQSQVITSLERSYAQKKVSCSLSSFDTWISTSTFGNPYHRLSFYSLGHRAGILLDLELNRVSLGKISMDDLFRYLMEQFYKKGKGVPEDGIEKACKALTGKDFTPFFNQYIHGTDTVPYDYFLETVGLKVTKVPVKDSGYKKVGITKLERNEGLFTLSVTPESDAADAGLQDRDLLVSVNGISVKDLDLDKEFNSLGLGKTIKCKVVREGEVKEAILTFSGKSILYDYKLEEIPGAIPVQIQNRENWLKTRVN